MAKITIRATIKVAWWWRYYSAGVRLMSYITGMQPDPSKVEAWARRAMTIHFKGREPNE